ncbi:FMO5-like protein [Mya arenaria]|uniref:Flavin-containing monooxygenase n=1 Tax=Mya arenaria TaxID=6604 RepID=A0ABY7ERQ1_MYAAR|nr:FMO5-like protein [Mya arenaria]
MVQSIYIKNLNKKFDHAKYCLQPNYPPLGSHPTMNDELPNRIVIGSVVVKANVSRFTENGVEFEDGMKVDNIDNVVMATGYTFGICFRQMKSTTPWRSSSVLMNNKREISLPDRSAMWEDIRNKQVTIARRFKASHRHTIQVDYVDFMDELAEIECKPNLRKLFFTDPKLAFDVFFGSASPYQYLLHGPGAWKPAQEYIQTQWERTFKPLNTRPCNADKAGSFGPMTIMLVLIVAFVAYFLVF